MPKKKKSQSIFQSENKIRTVKFFMAIKNYLTKEEQRRLRHLIARFEGTLHSNIKIICEENINNGQRKVVAAIKWFRNAYILQGDTIIKSWRVIV